MTAAVLEWLTATLDDVERLARAAMEYTDRDWSASVEPDARYGSRAFLYGDGDPIGELNPFGHDPRPILEHIVCHDPASTLASVKADRAILALHWTAIDQTGAVDGPPLCNECGGDYAPCATVLLVASRYAHRPGYLEEWKP